MLTRTRSEAPFFIALLIGSTVGGVGTMAAWSASLLDFLSRITLMQVIGLSATGMLFSFLPYLAIGVPACLALERVIESAFTRAAILGAGGAIIGAAITGFTDDFLTPWAAMIGGFSGLTLGILRRNKRRKAV